MVPAIPVLLLLPLIASSALGQSVRDEESEQYFKKWLDEDVRYIVNPEERSVFETLSAPEEKERFIEQFWRRRDPDPSRSINEFKEEHYRRIAYANERFKALTPPNIKYGDLQKVVGTRIHYEDLPIDTRASVVWVSAERFMVPVTLQVWNRLLTYQPENDIRRARAQISIEDLISGQKKDVSVRFRIQDNSG